MEIQDAQKMLAYLDIVSMFESLKNIDDGDIYIRGLSTTAFQHLNISGCVLEASPDQLLVMFGSSNDPLDFLVDSFFLPKKFSSNQIPGKVHSGFATAWHIIKKKALAAIHKKNPDKKKEIIFVGHSLGAALALYCACELRHSGYPMGKVYMAGSPRLGNKEFCEWVQAEIQYVRVVNGYDVVTAIPLAGMLGYKHLSGASYLKDGVLKETSRYRYNIAAYVTEGVSDHSLNEYIKNLDKYVKKALAH